MNKKICKAFRNVYEQKTKTEKVRYKRLLW